MVKGSLLVSLPNEQIVLNRGDIIFINSGVMHAASNAGDKECILHSVVFLPEFLCNGVEGGILAEVCMSTHRKLKTS